MRQVDPAHKVGLALIVLSLCLLLNKPLVGVTAVVGLSVGLIWLAGVPWPVFGQMLLAEGTFMLFATVGVVLSVSLTDPRPALPWAVSIGPLWLSSSHEALHQAITLMGRTLGAASAMNFLALTTPLVDMLELFRRWRFPVILVDLTAVMYRFIFVLLESLNTMRIAQESRLGYHTGYWRGMQNAALLGSRLFVEAFERSRRVQTALESRGYDGGDLRVLPITYQTDRRLLQFGLSLIASLLIIWWIP